MKEEFLMYGRGEGTSVVFEGGTFRLVSSGRSHFRFEES